MSDKALTDFVEEVCGAGHLRIEDDLGDGFVRLRSSEAQKRQAKHDIRSSEDIVVELLRNARDADANTIFLATTCKEKRRFITMLDDGVGIPPSLHSRVFEPLVTSKLDTMHVDKWGVHGRGMALYSIAENTERSYIAASEKDMGSAIVVESTIEQVPERKDQSSFPTAIINEKGMLSFRGPRNIIRTTCEFAFTHRKTCQVYQGTPTEIAATLYAFGKRARTSDLMKVPEDISETPIVFRLSLTSNPSEFTLVAEGLGLTLSERSARRIMDGDIEAVPSVYEQIAQSLNREIAFLNDQEQPIKKTRSNQRRKIALTHEDHEDLANAIKEAYAPLAQRYYLDATVEPVIKVKKDKITINIPLNTSD